MPARTRGDQDVEHVQRPQMRAHKASVSRTTVDKPGGQPASTTKPTIESVDGSLADEVEVPCITLAAGDRHDEVLSRGREDVVMLALAVHFSVEGQAGRGFGGSLHRDATPGASVGRGHRALPPAAAASPPPRL